MIFRNARIIMPREIVRGDLAVENGRIAGIGAARAANGDGLTTNGDGLAANGSGLDLEGDHLLPGLVELHTDHLENHYHPRPGVRWNARSAIQAHDAQIAASGITTVFDCLRIGTDPGMGPDDFEPGEMRALADAITTCAREGRLRAEHFLHLRCEVSADDAAAEFDAFRDVPNVRLASLMDHAPGQRQFRTMEQYTLYYKTKRGMSDEAFRRFCEERVASSARNSERHRLHIAAVARDRGIAVASHDDATLAHVADARRDGVAIAEFPTSVEAARASHEAGMAVLMGAPNVVRGRSHSGNVAARDLAEAGLLDVLSSDYVPLSLVHAPFVLHEELGIALPEAVRTVTDRPAEAVRLRDRGRIEEGRRADLVRVRYAPGTPPVVRGVWRGGERVA